jgi:hypothetical protein
MLQCPSCGALSISLKARKNLLWHIQLSLVQKLSSAEVGSFAGLLAISRQWRCLCLVRL